METASKVSSQELEELKTRFERLRYDTNRSIQKFKEEVKDTMDTKFFEMQCKLIKDEGEGEFDIVEQRYPIKPQTKTRPPSKNILSKVRSVNTDKGSSRIGT